MARAQGSLEYMVIIAMMIAISAIVIMYSTGIIGEQKSSFSVSLCKQAAVDCRASRILSPSDPCLSCGTACKDSSTGIEVTNDAVRCCKNARLDKIYEDSPGCPTGGTGPLAVTLVDPTANSIKGSPVTITATTNLLATCTYTVSLISGSLQGTMTTADQLTHTASVAISEEKSKTLTLTCVAGSESATTSPTPFYVDNTAPYYPSLFNTGPFIGPVMLSAEASDNIGVAKIEFYVNEEKFPPAPDPGCTFTSLITTPVKCTRMWNSTSLPDNAYILKVLVTDFAGHHTQRVSLLIVSNAGATLACGAWVKCSPTRSTIADCYADYPVAAPYNNYCCFTGISSCAGECCSSGSTCCQLGGLKTCCVTGKGCYNPEAGKIACNP